MNKLFKNPFGCMQKGAVAILCLVLLVLAGSSCKNEKCPCKEIIELPKENVCDVSNPLTDLTWLKEYIDEIKNRGEDHTSIFLCSYINGTGFLLHTACPHGIDCDNGTSYVLKNCEGETLCITDGANVLNCQEEFEVDFNNKILIYEINCHPNK
jgi:hypothetical protein